MSNKFSTLALLEIKPEETLEFKLVERVGQPIAW